MRENPRGIRQRVDMLPRRSPRAQQTGQGAHRQNRRRERPVLIVRVVDSAGTGNGGDLDLLAFAKDAGARGADVCGVVGQPLL